jgi:4-hydroxybenzoate polyprenyltransferase
VTNDLLDLAVDRKHWRKKHRPFAAGTLPLHQGPIAAFFLLVAGFSLAYAVAPHFALV